MSTPDGQDTGKTWPERPEIIDASGIATHNHFDRSLKDIGHCPACDLRFNAKEQKAYYGPNYGNVRRRTV